MTTILGQFHEVHQPLITKISLKITYLKFHSNLSGDNEIIMLCSSLYFGQTSPNQLQCSWWWTIKNTDWGVANWVCYSETWSCSSCWGSGLEKRCLVLALHLVLVILLTLHFRDISWVIQLPLPVIGHFSSDRDVTSVVIVMSLWLWCDVLFYISHNLGQVTKVQLPCYLVLLSVDSKTR